MIKITVNRSNVGTEINGEEEEVVLAEIPMVMHAIGDCLHNLRANSELSDEVFEFSKKTALLAFVGGCNGTDPAERYAHDGN